MVKNAESQPIRILYFDQYHFPEKASGLHLVSDLLDGMADRGWQVDLFVPVPTRGVDKGTRAIYKRERRNELTREGHVVIRRMALMGEGRNPIGRALRYAVFSMECFWKALVREYDVVFTGSGPPTQGWIIGLASRIKHRPLVYNLQDVFPDSLVVAGLTRKGSLLWKVGRVIEDSSYKSAKRIIAVSNSIKGNIVRKGANPEKISVVMNWEDFEAVRPIPDSENRLFEREGIDRNAFIVLYAGNLGATQNMDSFLELASRFDGERVQFVIFGNGSEEERLKNRAAELALKNLSFHALQPIEYVSEVYSMADLAFISCAKGAGSNSFPSKTWSILATGTPILASFDLNSDLGEAVRAGGFGVIVDPDDSQGLFSSLKRLIANRSELVAMGKRAREYGELNGSKAKAVNAYLNAIEEASRKDELSD